jgi:hypothetical protein
VAFTSEDWVRDVIGNFNSDGFSSLYPKYKAAAAEVHAGAAAGDQEDRQVQASRAWPALLDVELVEAGEFLPTRPASSICMRSPAVRSSPRTASLM